MNDELQKEVIDAFDALVTMVGLTSYQHTETYDKALEVLEKVNGDRNECK